jgi:hypothetical protein
LALRCINYLCQRHHDPDLPSEERYEKVLTGQYSFHPFSIGMWFELVRQYFRLIKASDPSVKLIDSMKMLWESRRTQGLHSILGNENENDSEGIFESLKAEQPLLYQVLGRVSRFRNSSFLFTGTTHQGKNRILQADEALSTGLPANTYQCEQTRRSPQRWS